ncbi:MAG: TetR/AcrR family transcriptional regulator [Terracidiphilus sp.]
MSRPRSEQKRQAILDAAFRVFVERGVAASPTSAISKAAGVAEGTLFTYFKTKEELMHELYLELRQGFSRNMYDFPHKADARTRMRYLWDKSMEYGAAHPEDHDVRVQLRSPGRLFREKEIPTLANIEALKAVRDVVGGNELRNAPPELLVLLMRAQVEVTLEFITAHPEWAEVCKDLGFKALWRGLGGK